MSRAAWTAWGAVAALALPGCKVAGPAAAYKRAAKQLTFTLERVEPSLLISHPLEKSRLGLRVFLAARNPTEVRFHARRLAGDIALDSDGASHAVGRLDVSQGIDLQPTSTTPMTVDLFFAYADIQRAWVALKNVGSGNRPGTWRLDGRMELVALGLPLEVPVKIQKHVSGR